MEDKMTNPFPGLRPFEEEEEHLFFGRDNAVAELMSRLRTSRFLAVIGTSGSGKSSLIKAGLLPSLYRGFMSQAGSNWRVAVFRPGDDPIGNLARVLTGGGVLYESADDDDDRGSDRNVIWGKFIETTLRRSNRGLIEVVKQARLPGHENLLIVVDQFEELFRFCKLERSSQDEKRDSTAFVNLLLETAAQVQLPVYILLTMRSDFLGDCTEFRGLPEAINKGQYLIPRMTRDERRAAVTGPVAVGGASITPTLVSRLLNDVGENPDQLPILQHAMMRTWDHWTKNHREGEPLDLRDYEAIGTMTRALSKHAEEAFAELKTQKSLTICEKMFKLLTDREETGRGVRRPARVSEICRVTNASEREVIKVIDVFRRPGRTFLMPPPGITLGEDTVIDISHESLMRIWTRLIRWVKEEEQSAQGYLRLANAAAWHEQGKVGLWRDPELMLALNWRRETKPNAVWAKRYDPSFDRAIGFLEASKKQQELEIAEKEKEQRAKKRLRRAITTIIVIGAVTSILFAIWAWDSKNKADAARDDALTQKINAKIAERKAKISEGAAKKSERKAKISEKKARTAEEDAKEKAEEARLAKEKSEKNEKQAKENELKAKFQGLIVNLNRTEATFRQNMATAKKVALHSIAQKKDKDLKANLAVKAYQMLRDAASEFIASTTEILMALYRLRQRDEWKTFPGEKELEDRIRKLRSGRPTDFPTEIFEALREAYIADEPSEDIIYENAESWALDVFGSDIVFNQRDGQLLKLSIKHLHPGTAKRQPIKETMPLAKNTLLPAACFARGGSRLFCGTMDGRVVLIKGEAVPLAQHKSKVLAIAFSNKRNCLIYSVKNSIYILYLKKNTAEAVKPVRVLAFEEGNFIRALTVIESRNSEDSFLIAGDAKGNVFQWNLSGDVGEKKRLNTSLKSSDSAFHAIAYNSVKNLLALANAKGKIFLLTGIHSDTLKSNGKITSYSFESRHKGIVRALAFSPRAYYLASGGLDRTLMLWDLNVKDAEIVRQAPILIIHSKQKILAVGFDREEEYLVFSDEKHLRLCPTDLGSLHKRLSTKKRRELTHREVLQYISEDVKQRK